MKSSPELESKLAEIAAKGLIEVRYEANPYLKVSYKGAGGLVTPKWNIKIYTSGSVVCNEGNILQGLLQGTLKAPDQSLQVMQIDDAGVGFPLMGVMVGVSDGKKIITGVIDVSYFKPETFDTKDYLKAYSIRGKQILFNDFKIKKETHRIEICTGYINRTLKNDLMGMGFDVRATEIKGMLQDSLERLFKEYVHKETGVDLAYDPKELGDPREIGSRYYSVLNWGKTHAPHLLKSGWKSMKGI
jgi:hypothetical protein